jgi:hypothetical protein
MKVRAATLFAFLLMSGFALPAFGTDYIIVDPKWGQMSQDQKDQTIKELTRKGLLKPGKDKVIYSPGPFSKYSNPLGKYSKDQGQERIIEEICCWLRQCC